LQFSGSRSLLLAYHGLAALPKHETKRKMDGAKDTFEENAESETR
jgi:hypothetical protein